MDNQFIVPVFLGVGVLLSVAFFGVFKAGQVFERSTIVVERIHTLELEKLKQKTSVKLEMLWNSYERNRNENNMELPEGLHYKDIVNHAFIMDESISEQILGLNQIYLDLICKGTSSSYFVDILGTYGHLIS